MFILSLIGVICVSSYKFADDVVDDAFLLFLNTASDSAVDIPDVTILSVLTRNIDSFALSSAISSVLSSSKFADDVADDNTSSK